MVENWLLGLGRAQSEEATGSTFYVGPPSTERNIGIRPHPSWVAGKGETQTEDIVVLCKEHVKDLLNPATMSSAEEAEPEVSGEFQCHHCAEKSSEKGNQRLSAGGMAGRGAHHRSQ
ncbi:hypothetical protein AMECASPLE_017810 [Ameca splendens]|uniref:Uncharacterized protein n=1 Tax=Ameca splendens TaxID=208324 RepID=A0ABV0ZBU7_9TELE